MLQTIDELYVRNITPNQLLSYFCNLTSRTCGNNDLDITAKGAENSAFDQWINLAVT
jgi:hypothetical protein